MLYYYYCYHILLFYCWLMAYHIIVIMLLSCYCYLSGWWFQHFWNILVSWDDEIPNISIYGKINNVPNHQPVIISFTTYTTYQLRYAWHHLMSDGALDVQGAAFSLQPRWRTTSGERYLGDTTCCRWTVEAMQPWLWVKFSHTGWCPPVISWFINPIKYSYIYINIYAINHNYGSYKPT